ncbi:MAG: DNA-processing protein DprA [Planctomycetota bacterium]|nr:DNA-processing protein DprA [Planctomycetota bacterium]
MIHDAELLNALRLHLVPGIGPRTTQTLLEAFGSPARALEATEAELLSVEGIGPKLAKAVRAARVSDEAHAELARCREIGASVTARGTAGYPHLLSQIPDAPAVLYSRGELLPQDEIAVAIVGSRRCTYYGISQAEKIAGGLARAGVTVISGLAKGRSPGGLGGRRSDDRRHGHRLRNRLSAGARRSRGAGRRRWRDRH